MTAIGADGTDGTGWVGQHSRDGCDAADGTKWVGTERGGMGRTERDEMGRNGTGRGDGQTEWTNWTGRKRERHRTERDIAGQKTGQDRTDRRHGTGRDGLIRTQSSSPGSRVARVICSAVGHAAATAELEPRPVGESFSLPPRAMSTDAEKPQVAAPSAPRPARRQHPGRRASRGGGGALSPSSPITPQPGAVVVPLHSLVN